MAFVFYKGKAQQLRDRTIDHAQKAWGNGHHIESDDFCLLAQRRCNDLGLYSGDNAHLCLTGYVGKDGRSDDVLPLLLSLVKDNIWPLDDSWFGSFSCVAIVERTENVILANDALGYYPLYYHVLGPNELIAGTSQIMISRIIHGRPDAIGLLQTLSRPYFSNYGRRTLIKDVCRLLPGELMVLSDDYLRGVSLCDNTLFSDLQMPPVREAAEKVFGLVRKHVRHLNSLSEQTYLGLSGGWDSRIILAGAPREQLNCFTYGQGACYETKIAKRCSDATGQTFASFPYERFVFPAADLYAKHVEQTEAVYITPWLAVLDGAGPVRGFPVFMMGDMCEAIDARNIRTCSSRKARRRSALRGLIGIRERFTPFNERDFMAWEDGIVSSAVASQMANVPLVRRDLFDNMHLDSIRAQLVEDVCMTTRRIRDNAPCFIELLDELLGWHLHGRLEMGRQMLLMNSRFACVSPTMSFQILRATSNLHPRLRLRRRLMNAIAGLEAVGDLAQIPSAQIPFVSMRAPAILKDAVWACRSGIDQMLIRRMMKKKNIKKRYRVLRSFNLPAAYEEASRSGVVKSWFSGRWFAPQSFLSTVDARACLKKWPVTNVDIVGPATASKILDLAMDWD